MTSLHRGGLVLALCAIACSDDSIAAPRTSGQLVSGPQRLAPPADVRASLVGGGKGVLISWRAPGAAGFLVQRATAEDSWGIIGFTRLTSMGDAVIADLRQCYRVTAVAASSQALDSPPSDVVCVGKPVY